MPKLPTSFKSEFKGKYAFVTGGSSGMGYQTALELAQNGAQVVFIARNSHPTWYTGEQAATNINADSVVQKNGGKAYFFQADQRNNTQIRAAIQYAHSLFGDIDYFVNAAAIAGWVMNTDQLQDDYLLGEHDSILNNLYGVLNLLRAETSYLMTYGNKTKKYSIVNFSSYNGLRGCQTCTLYSASKHGIIGLTLSTAEEFIDTQPSIRINAVAPGLVNTSLTWQQCKTLEYGIQDWEGDYITPSSDLWKKWLPVWESGITGGLLAEPNQETDAVLFLLSSQASYMTGEVISVDNDLSTR